MILQQFLRLADPYLIQVFKNIRLCLRLEKPADITFRYIEILCQGFQRNLFLIMVHHITYGLSDQIIITLRRHKELSQILFVAFAEDFHGGMHGSCLLHFSR